MWHIQIAASSNYGNVSKQTWEQIKQIKTMNWELCKIEPYKPWPSRVSWTTVRKTCEQSHTPKVNTIKHYYSKTTQKLLKPISSKQSYQTKTIIQDYSLHANKTKHNWPLWKHTMTPSNDEQNKAQSESNQTLFSVPNIIKQTYPSRLCKDQLSSTYSTLIFSIFIVAVIVFSNRRTNKQNTLVIKDIQTDIYTHLSLPDQKTKDSRNTISSPSYVSQVSSLTKPTNIKIYKYTSKWTKHTKHTKHIHTHHFGIEHPWEIL